MVLVQIESDVITTIQLLEETLEAQEQAKIAEAKVTEVDKTIGSLESKTAKAKVRSPGPRHAAHKQDGHGYDYVGLYLCLHS